MAIFYSLTTQGSLGPGCDLSDRSQCNCKITKIKTKVNKKVTIPKIRCGPASDDLGQQKLNSEEQQTAKPKARQDFLSYSCLVTYWKPVFKGCPILTASRVSQNVQVCQKGIKLIKSWAAIFCNMTSYNLAEIRSEEPFSSSFRVED